VQRYPVRTSHRGNLSPEAIVRLLRAHFDDATLEGTSARASFGAIVRLTVWAEGRDLAVDVTMNPKVADEVARDTIARYNRFLEEATGYSARDRAKRLRKSAGAPEPGT
jgi:hypothetical protein